MSIFYYKGEDGAFHPVPALVGPPGKDGVIAQIEDENGTKYNSLPTLKFLNCEVTTDTEKVTVSPRGGQGGSGGGHTIQDSENSNLPQRGILKFAEGFQVSDDSTNGKTVISCAAGTKNVAGYVGEISLFADNQLRENHVWADGSTINPTTWPDLAAYAATAGWETDSGTGWYKTPNLQGCFLLPSSAEYAVNTTGGEATHSHTYGVRYSEYYGTLVDGITVKDYPTGAFSWVKSQATTGQYINGGLTTQKNEASPVQYLAEAQTSAEPTMPPYYVVTAQIRAKVDIISATAVEVNGNTLGGFGDGQVLAQQGGKIVGKEITAASLGAVQPYQAGDTITLGRCCVSGFISGGGKDLIFTVPLDRPAIATGATFSGEINVRGSSGEYAVRNYQYSTAQILSISSAGIAFTGSPTWTNQPTNNIALSVDIKNGTITLS